MFGGSPTAGAHMQGRQEGRESLLGKELSIEDGRTWGVPGEELLVRSIKTPISDKIGIQNKVAWQKIIRFDEADFTAWREFESKGFRQKAKIGALAHLLIVVLAVLAMYAVYQGGMRISAPLPLVEAGACVVIAIWVYCKMWEYLNKWSDWCIENKKVLLQKQGYHNVSPHNIGNCGGECPYALLKTEM